MLTKISTRFHRWAQGWRIATLLAVFVVFEGITVPLLRHSPGGTLAPLDARFFYLPAEAYSTVEAYGDARSFWIGAYLTWDVVNPVLYTLLLSLSISWLFQRSVGTQSRLQKLNLVPLGAGLCDILENVSIVTLLGAYPLRLTAIAWLATLLTMSKVAFFGGSVALILLGVIKAATNRCWKIVVTATTASSEEAAQQGDEADRA